MSARAWVAAALLAALPVLPAAAAGQSLAARVGGVRDGTVRFHFDAKPGVEVCDQGIRIGPHDYIQWRSRGWDEDRGTSCRSGFLEVEISRRSGAAHEVRIVRRPADRTADATELGAIAAGAAAHYLLSVAHQAEDVDAADHALLPAVLADADSIWPDLLSIARDHGVRERVRKSALFWLGQEAGDVVTRGLRAVARGDDESQDVRDAAVFALSQRPADESVPALMELARTAPQAKTRKTALFWLAQSPDPRVPGFFEEILVGKKGGREPAPY
jgi:hypothetical protein